MKQPFQLVSPDRLQIRQGGGCLAMFGLPFFAAAHVGGPSGTEVAHRLLIPVCSSPGMVTHCMVFTVL